MSRNEKCVVCGQIKSLLGDFKLSNSSNGAVCSDCWNKATEEEKVELRRKFEAYFKFSDDYEPEDEGFFY